MLADVDFDIPIDADKLAGFRAAMKEDTVLGDADAANVIRQEVFAPSITGPDVRCLLYVPDNDDGSRAGYLHIHGGGYIMGEPEMSDVMSILIAEKLGAVVCSVDYRLAPEHPVPAPLDDCYAALAWFHQHASEWNVDTSRIGIGGESAGGGLAAALAIHARYKGEYAICHQHLTYPMIDNLTGTESNMGDPLTGEFVWTRESNRFGWASYLGEAPAVAPQVPSRLEDYASLPNTWLYTASMDLFRDENIAYAQELMKAGVSTELIVLAGACHGFQMVPGTSLGKKYVDDFLAALEKGLG